MTLTLAKMYFGMFVNALGFPGFVRDCEYGSKHVGAKVTVKRSGLYTTVTVNGIDVFFNRLTGTIDGVGRGSYECDEETPHIAATPPPSEAFEVFPSQGWIHHQCSRKNGHGPNGLYCKQHAKRV